MLIVLIVTSASAGFSEERQTCDAHHALLIDPPHCPDQHGRHTDQARLSAAREALGHPIMDGFGLRALVMSREYPAKTKEKNLAVILAIYLSKNCTQISQKLLRKSRPPKFRKTFRETLAQGK